MAVAQKITVPIDVDIRSNEVKRINEFIDQVLALGNKIKSNEQQLMNLQDELRMLDLKENFYTVAEVAEALHCTPKTALKLLKEKDVPILDHGKTYVVFKENFLNAFRAAS